MKNLIVLTALAGLAAFQVGCAEQSAPTPSPPPTMMGGKMPVPPEVEENLKKAQEDKAKDAATGDAKSDDAASTDDKTTEEESPKE
jgi:hypothetical protein